MLQSFSKTIIACSFGLVATMASAADMSDAEIENIVKRSFQYVAMYNVNNKSTDRVGGWNLFEANSELLDHTVKLIARPNNDTLYVVSMLDVRKEPVILEIPAFESKYVSLMVSGYDHYVSIPLSTRQGDFEKPERILFYSERTEGYSGESVDGIDHIFEATGDLLQATARIMPHANEPDRFQRIVEQMESFKLMTLSEFQGGTAKPIEDIEFPPVGETDADIFGNNLLEVMQFVFNHTTFDPDNPEDQAVLAAYKPLGVAPGNAYDPKNVVAIDDARFKETAQRIQREYLGRLGDLELTERMRPLQFQEKGKTELETLLVVSIVGPIGIPQEEAVYPQVMTSDGNQMNAKHDYVIRMSRDEMPPAKAFWSLTLYDLDQGFFIPNDHKKYSVGENGGMKLNEEGGIDIYIAAQKPEGVPEENWLPIRREDLNLSPQMRIYVPDLEAYENWKPPIADRAG